MAQVSGNANGTTIADYKRVHTTDTTDHVQRFLLAVILARAALSSFYASRSISGPDNLQPRDLCGPRRTPRSGYCYFLLCGIASGRENSASLSSPVSLSFYLVRSSALLPLRSIRLKLKLVWRVCFQVNFLLVLDVYNGITYIYE